MACTAAVNAARVEAKTGSAAGEPDFVNASCTLACRASSKMRATLPSPSRHCCSFCSSKRRAPSTPPARSSAASAAQVQARRTGADRSSPSSSSMLANRCDGSAFSPRITARSTRAGTPLRAGCFTCPSQMALRSPAMSAAGNGCAPYNAS
jgi:hypothetical protein